MRKRFANQNTTLNIRGSAIIMALVTMTILLLLGLAVATLSMGTLTANTADAITNDAYYAADAGVNAGLDQLKLEVARYYKNMMDAQGSTYTSLYNNFAAGISAKAQTNFSEPSFEGGSTSTTFSVAGHDAQTNVYELLTTTTSTMADGTKYVVEGRLKVKRVDVSAKSWFSDLGALVVGETLKINTSSGITVNGGNAVLGALVNHVPWDYTVKAPGQTIIDPNVKNFINDVLVYPSFSEPVISNPTYYITANTTLSNSNYPWTNPVSVDTASNVNLTISNSNIIPAGIIRSRGDMTIYTGGNIYSDLYCRNLSENGRAIYGNIYARGNITKTGGNIFGNIYCDGNVTLSQIGIHGSIICGGDVTIQGATALGNVFANGTIRLSNMSASGNVIYSKTKIVTTATLSAIVFSGGDIEFGSGTGNVTGAVISKGNCTISGWPTINYNANDIAAKLANIKGTFFDPGGGAATLDADVFQGQSITAKGRVN